MPFSLPIVYKITYDKPFPYGKVKHLHYLRGNNIIVLNNQPIGLFDSGMGGLTIAHALRQALPKETLLYYGDSKHLPYGDKSAATISAYSSNITRFLCAQRCKLIVVACNSASANALTSIRNIATQANVTVLDVISPVAEYVAQQGYQRVGIIATQATINSAQYQHAIHAHRADVIIKALPTPLLVPIIEENLCASAISDAAITHYLNQPNLADIDCLIPACTHYPLLADELRVHLAPEVVFINAPSIIAQAIKHRLRQSNLLADRRGEDQFYVSDSSIHFSRLAHHFFGQSLRLIQHDVHST